MPLGPPFFSMFVDFGIQLGPNMESSWVPKAHRFRKSRKYTKSTLTVARARLFMICWCKKASRMIKNLGIDFKSIFMDLGTHVRKQNQAKSIPEGIKKTRHVLERAWRPPMRAWHPSASPLGRHPTQGVFPLVLGAPGSSYIILWMMCLFISISYVYIYIYNK